MDDNKDGDEIWDLWYSDLAKVIDQIGKDLTSGVITYEEALERIRKL